MSARSSGTLKIDLSAGLTKDNAITGLLGLGRIGALVFSIPTGATVAIHYDQEAIGFPIANGAAFNYAPCGECRAVSFTAAAFAGFMYVQVWALDDAVTATSNA